jgi:hypothetical protein
MQLTAINEAQPGQILLARHPKQPMVLMVVAGTTVVVGMTIEQVDNLIDQLTIHRDRVVHEMSPNIPHRPTPIPSV